MEAVSKEERGGDGLIELTTIIVLNYLDGDAKLSLKIGKKIVKDGKGIRHKAQRKHR